MNTEAQSRPAGRINGTELRVVGLSRSGNHAILNWIMANLTGRYVFLNCAQPKSDPFLTARPLADGRCWRSNDPAFDPDRGRYRSRDWLIYSYEDCFLGMVGHRDFEARREAWLGPSKRRLNLLILRDPLNLFASRRAGLPTEPETTYRPITPATLTRIWKQHARAFLGEIRPLSGPLVAVSYNRWVQEADYRRQLARQLGLEDWHQGASEVADCAGGSSFDGLALRERAGDMAVLERWRHFRDDPDYWTMFDGKLLELARRIFGPLPVPETAQPASRPSAEA